MSKPNELSVLIEELRADNLPSSVETVPTSEAILYVNPQDYDGIKLNADECRMIFADTSTVDRLIDALPELDEASIMLFDLILSDEVRDALERRFTSVDEG